MSYFVYKLESLWESLIKYSSKYICDASAKNDLFVKVCLPDSKFSWYVFIVRKTEKLNLGTEKIVRLRVQPWERQASVFNTHCLAV